MTTSDLRKIAAAALAASAAAFLAIFLAHAEAAKETGRADAGRTIANALCVDCHAIEAGATSSSDTKAPPFAAFVTHEKLTSTAIAGWLTSSHPAMPDFALTAEQRADLIAYIKSLVLKPAPAK